MQPRESEIRERSYQIWESEGRPEGRAWDHWLRAETELQAEGNRGSSGKAREGRASGAKVGNGRRKSAGTKGGAGPTQVMR